MKKATYNFILLLASLIFSIAIVEISLRVFYPKYDYAAESHSITDKHRIWTRKKNALYERKHPDTKDPHLVYHNNLSLRQNRNFDPQDIESGINIGVFGDSFTENLRLPAQYSFTELLDYLLNTGTLKFNVLNLGVDSYGTDQAYLYYRDFEYSKDLDYIFYIFCVNDLRNIYENNLFSITKTKGLIQNQVQDSPWWVKAINGYHTTYLIQDVLQRLQLAGDKIIQTPDLYYLKRGRKKRFHDERADFIEHAFLEDLETEDLEKCIAIFKSLLQQWKQTVEKNSAKFCVVLLPRPEEHKARRLFSEEYDLIDLYDQFDSDIEHYDYYRGWKFSDDNHWNEAANQLTAIYLYRAIEKDLRIKPISEDTLKKELYTYYASFDGWMPNNSFIKKIDVTPDKRQKIKSKYDFVEMHLRYSLN